MLRERNISLWEANHYKPVMQLNAAGARKSATTKDPVTVILKIPDMLERDFRGHGPTIDDAVTNALIFSFNRPLRLREAGITGAMARLERELEALWDVLWRSRYANMTDDELDDDVPF
jgi:hypothetical protein